MNCIDVVFTKPKNKKGDCPKISVEFYAPPTDKGGCNNISVVFEKIAVDDVIPICTNTLFWDIQSSTGFTLVIEGSGNVVLDGTEESMNINKSISNGVEIAFCDSADVTSFHARDGGITGNIPTLPQGIEVFDAHTNSLTGNIPTLPSSLIDFSISRNNLTGNIPTLPNSLVYLSVFSNSLDGNIPTLPPLIEWVQVGDNNLDGNIPTLPPKLRFFEASDSDFTGSIPSFNDDLENFDVNRNRLTGNIPTFSNLLRSVDFYDNYLSGFDGGAMPSAENIKVGRNSMSTSSIDAMLQSLSENSVTNGLFTASGANMGIPTNTSAIDTLRARGWYVQVEGGY